VTSIAEGFVLRVAAAAQRNVLATGKPVEFALHVNQFDRALDTQGPVISHDNFRHFKSSPVLNAKSG